MTDTKSISGAAAGTSAELPAMLAAMKRLHAYREVEPATIATVAAAAAELQRLTMQRDALAARLAIEYDSEPAEHLYAGDCPDDDQPDARDPACPACLAMLAAAPQPPAAEPVRLLADESPAAEPLPTIRTGRYRHYKGGEYRVLGVARHSESLAPMVVYRSLGSDGGDWVRPFGMFFETVEHEGQRVPRFELLEDEPAPQALTAAQRELLAALRHIRGAALDIAVERTAIARAASDAIAKAEKGGAA